MRISDYLMAVHQVEQMKVAEGGDIALEERCRLLLQRIIEINNQLFALKGQVTELFEIDFIEGEMARIESDQQTLTRRLTQAGSLISDNRVNEALNHIEAVYQSLPILLS